MPKIFVLLLPKFPISATFGGSALILAKNVCFIVYNIHWGTSLTYCYTNPNVVQESLPHAHLRSSAFL